MNHALVPVPTLSALALTGWFRQKRMPAPAMQTRRTVHEIARRDTVKIARAQGAVVECLDGCVWITLDGDLRDCVLEAGQSLCIDRDRRVLVHALKTSRVRIAVRT